MACPYARTGMGSTSQGLLPDSQFVHFFERGPATTTDDGCAVATHEGVGHFNVAGRAVERLAAVFCLLVHGVLFGWSEIYTICAARPSLNLPLHDFLKIAAQDRLDFFESAGKEMVGRLDPAEALGFSHGGVECFHLVARAKGILSPGDEQFGFGRIAQKPLPG